MHPVLQIVLALVVVVLGGFLVPLLLQMYRTAKAVQALAESARTDLHQISLELREARLQLDRVARLAERSLEFPATLSALGASFTRSVSSLLEGKSSPWLVALVTVLKIGLDFFKRPSEAAPSKETGNE